MSRLLKDVLDFYLNIGFEGRKLVEDTLVWGSSAIVANIVILFT